MQFSSFKRKAVAVPTPRRHIISSTISRLVLIIARPVASMLVSVSSILVIVLDLVSTSSVITILALVIFASSVVLVPPISLAPEGRQF